MPMVYSIPSTVMICLWSKQSNWDARLYIMRLIETQVQVVLLEYIMFIKTDGLRR